MPEQDSHAHGPSTEVDWLLTINIKARVTLNEEVNAYQARVYTERMGMNALYLQALDIAAARGLQQSFRVFPGLTLVGCKTELGVNTACVTRCWPHKAATQRRSSHLTAKKPCEC